MKSAWPAAWPYLVSGLLLMAAGWLASLLLGPELAPPPLTVLAELGRLAWSGALARELGVTVARALAGVAAANLLGVALGLAAGLHPAGLRLLAPLVAALQACPPVVWISLAMVWAGAGSLVPMLAVLAATLPPLFANVAQGALALDPRLSAMSRLFAVPARTRLTRMLLPAVRPFWLAGFSYTLASGWKVTAVAEFMGSHDGVGSRIFWAYRRMDMAELHAWALAIILLGMVLETGLVAPLRRAAQARTGAAEPGGRP
ncbi:MAG: ABC transporter permease subunit [Pseudomonadota bacterium]